MRSPPAWSIRPPTGGCSPSSVRTKVDLPAPFGPSTAHSCPGEIDAEIGGRISRRS